MKIKYLFLTLSAAVMPLIQGDPPTEFIHGISTPTLNGFPVSQADSFFIGNGVSIGTSNYGYIVGDYNSTVEPGNYIFGTYNHFQEGAWDSFISGRGNTVKGDGNGSVSVYGAGNQIDAWGDLCFFGMGNVVKSCSDPTIFGHDNIIDGSSDYNPREVWVYGGGIKVISLSKSIYQVFYTGLYNATINFSASEYDSDAPSYVIANGNSDTVRSNALIIQKSGRTTILNRNYVVPTTGTPNPVEPEAFVVSGSASIKGIARVRPGGDLDMGDFTAATAGAP